MVDFQGRDALVQAVADDRHRPQNLPGHVVHLRQGGVVVLFGEEHPLPLPEEHRPAGELPGILGEAAVHIGHRPVRPLRALGNFPLGGGGARPLEEGFRFLPGGEALVDHPFHPMDLGLAGVPALIDTIAVPAVLHRVKFFWHIYLLRAAAPPLASPAEGPLFLFFPILLKQRCGEVPVPRVRQEHGHRLTLVFRAAPHLAGRPQGRPGGDAH